MILLAHPYFLRDDAKQLARMKPYPPLATLLAAAVLRDQGHDVTLFDAMLAEGVEEFRSALAQARPAMVAIVEDSFNYITKMCTTRLRDATIEMIAAAHEHGCRVVVSGSDATDHPRRYLDGGADAVLLGEAEATLAEVAALWRTDIAAPLDAVAGLALRDAESGEMTVTEKRINPDWTPTADMRRANPTLPAYVPGGHRLNPLGVRALYLGSSTYRIHGTDAPWTIGQNASSGCVRMFNNDVIDLYNRAKIGTRVIVTWQTYS